MSTANKLGEYRTALIRWKERKSHPRFRHLTEPEPRIESYCNTVDTYVRGMAAKIKSEVMK